MRFEEFLFSWLKIDNKYSNLCLNTSSETNVNTLQTKELHFIKIS